MFDVVAPDDLLQRMEDINPTCTPRSNRTPAPYLRSRNPKRDVLQRIRPTLVRLCLARPSQCLGELSCEWSMPLHRRMRFKLLPVALVREKLLRRTDLKSVGTAKRSTTSSEGGEMSSMPRSHLLRCVLLSSRDVAIIQQMPLLPVFDGPNIHTVRETVIPRISSNPTSDQSI